MTYNNIMSADHLPHFFKQPIDRPEIWVHPSEDRAENVSSLNIGGSDYRKIIFFPRNTLPLLTPSDNPKKIYINNPPWIDPNKVSRFLRDLPGGTEVIGEPANKPFLRNPGQEMYIESYPASITAAALSLNPDNRNLLNLDTAFRQPLKPIEYSEFLDLILAGKYVDKDGAVKSAPDFEGERLMLGALIGHTQSAAELVRRRVAFDLEFGFKDSARLDRGARSPDGIALDDLVAVHATKYLPSQEANDVFVKSMFDGSHEDITRLSVHFALNHHVVSHKGGNWEDSPYVVVSPLTDLIRENGVPAAMRAEDTFFTISPGGGLKLPKTSVLIRPEEDAATSPLPIETVTYRSRDFTKQDLGDLSGYWQEMFWSKRRIDDFRMFDRGEKWRGHTHPGKFHSLEDLVRARINGVNEDTSYAFSYGSRIETAKEVSKGLSLLGWKFLRGKTHVPEGALYHLALSLKPEDVAQFMVNADFNDIEGDLSEVLGPVNKVRTAEQVIKAAGYNLLPVDPYYLDVVGEKLEDDEIPANVKDLLILAERSGISTKRHPFSVDHDFDEAAMAISKLLNGEYEFTSPYEARGSLKVIQAGLSGKFNELSQEYRRLAYLTGIIHVADYPY